VDVENLRDRLESETNGPSSVSAAATEVRASDGVK
jgi:hypothetical protein